MVSDNGRFAITVLALVACLATPAAATILTFDMDPNIGDYSELVPGTVNYNPMPQTYGDHLNGEQNGTFTEGSGWTPNVDIDYAATPGGDLAWYADGLWSGATFRLVAEGDEQHGSVIYTLTPDDGYGVQVNSFVLDDYPQWQTLDEQMEWRLWGDSIGGVLLASASVLVPEGTRVLVETGASPYFGSVILEVDHVGGDIDGDIGVDDLDFDQTEGTFLLGDVNLDGEVNGLDVDPFVGLVTGGEFQVEADMNEDGTVNGLDVEPFVDAVVGGGGVSVVPEPATWLLLLTGLVACSLARRGMV